MTEVRHVSVGKILCLTPSLISLSRFLWRPAFSNLSELLHGRHGDAASWAVPAAAEDSAPAQQFLQRAVPAGAGAH